MENNFINLLRILPQYNNSNIIFTGIINGNDILEQSFNEEKPKLKPLCNHYKKQLIECKLTDDELSSEICCSICQDNIEKDENVIKLQCKDQIHYFHIGDNKEKCEGIYPWFEENNTCPMCRTEFPAEPEPEPEPEPEQGAEPEPEQGAEPEPEQGVDRETIQGDEPENIIPIIQISNIFSGINIPFNNDINENQNPLPRQFNTNLNNILDEIRDIMEEDELQATILRSIEEK